MGEIVVMSSDEEEVCRERNGKRRNGMVRWDMFLPKIMLRVLLVEADDSTRQIIAALLRKCSYKVVAVSDGLKAWEVIKGRAKDIDLILTEVDLPSISGFPLLTLITEHEACKNIPVIMMSSHDSVNMVYKCMLRGAADFLTKPIRRNELTNLWQHIWRRQSSITKIQQHKVEKTYENNSASDYSNGSMVCVHQKDGEVIEKLSDTQSSCTKPELEVESCDVENVQDLSETKISQEDEDSMKLNQTLLTHETFKIASITTQCEEMEQEKETCDREAIDLIGSFDNDRRCENRNSCSNYGINKLDFLPHLDLSLRRFHHDDNENQLTDETYTINHSTLSPFSRYQSWQPFPSTLTSVTNQEIEQRTDSDKCFPKKSVVCLDPNQPRQAEVHPFKHSYHYRDNFDQLNNQVHQNTNFTNQILNQKELDCLEDEHISLATDRSITSSLCNGGAASQFNTSVGCGSVCGSNGNVNLVTVARDAAESKNESILSRRSIQREEALTKFRLKKKDRCYEKKVRYESRKKLAEKRPRVKGQFVRQVRTKPSTLEIDDDNMLMRVENLHKDIDEDLR